MMIGERIGSLPLLYCSITQDVKYCHVFMIVFNMCIIMLHRFNRLQLLYVICYSFTVSNLHFSKSSVQQNARLSTKCMLKKFHRISKQISSLLRLVHGLKSNVLVRSHH